ncbi:hypothetical protein Dimus_023138 [Dionaea muscipula]
MAAEASASRSTGSSPDSYIGSFISLTSKSEIRYEGILFNINTDEASIGLRNVRSFGTEGRRKDGPQVPVFDRVYEYIVFRGSDIKDLQVKSSPPVQAPPTLHNDPAIIQSHSPQTSASGSSFPSTTVGPVSDLSTQTSLPGPSTPALQGGLPLYQPEGNLGSWNSSTPPQSSGGGLAMPMYWQGYYGPSSNLQNQPPPFLRPPQGLPMSPSLQHPSPYPIMNASLPIGPSRFSAMQPLDFPPQLIPPIVSSGLNMQSTMLPVQSPQPTSDAFTSLMSIKAPQILSTISQSSTLPFAPPLATAVDRSLGSSLVLDQAKQVSRPMMPYNSLHEPTPAAVGTSTSPSLVTPGQFFQPGSTTILSSQSSQTTQKDVEVVQVSTSVSQAPMPPSAAAIEVPASASRDSQEPLLSLPNSNQKFSHNRYINRGSRARGRGSELSRSATSFTEDFDFEAMNEKFNKDEVWGHLGKSKVKFDDGEYLPDEEDSEFPEVEIKPVYTKDDFFDTLSCNSLDNGSRNGRPRFSEQTRLDTETFGDHRRFRGRAGRVRGHGGGRSHGGYYGRGYGYGGRGRERSI